MNADSAALHVSGARPSVESINPLHAADAAQPHTADGIELRQMSSLCDIVQANREARKSADVDESPQRPGGSDADAAESRIVVFSSRLRSASSSTIIRTRAWCKTEGLLGAFIIVIYVIIIINLSLNLVLHCTPILSWFQGRPGVREMLLVDGSVASMVGLICTLLLAKAVWSLVLVTCRHGNTHASAANRLQRSSKYRILRVWNLYQLLKSPGGRFFE
jgi:hypothetical protein